MHEEDKPVFGWLFISYGILAVIMYYIIGAIQR